MFKRNLYSRYIKDESKWLIALHCLAGITLAKFINIIHDLSFSPIQNPSQLQKDIALSFIVTIFVAFFVLGYELSSALVLRIKKKNHSKAYVISWATFLLLISFIIFADVTSVREAIGHGILNGLMAATLAAGYYLTQWLSKKISPEGKRAKILTWLLFVPATAVPFAMLALVAVTLPSLMGKLAVPKKDTTTLAISSSSESKKEGAFAGFIEESNRTNNTPVLTKDDQDVFIPRSIRKFTARLDTEDSRDKFITFISENDGRIVYIDAFIPKKLAHGDESFSLTYDCGESYGCPGEEYLIHLSNNSDAMYLYIPRLQEEYHLKGYWAVMAKTAFNQGIFSNVLRGVATESIHGK